MNPRTPPLGPSIAEAYGLDLDDLDDLDEAGLGEFEAYTSIAHKVVEGATIMSDAPARYSDEANLEPVARAAEVTPEIETELPEAGARVEVDDEPQLVAGTFLGLDDEGRAIVSIVPPWLWCDWERLRRPGSGE